MLDDRRVNGTTEISVLVSDDASLVSDRVVDILDPALAQELVPSLERYLNNSTKLGKFACSIVFNICNAFKVGNKLFDDGFPSDKALNEDIGWTEVVGSNVLFDKRLTARDGRALFAGS